ncbi:glycosyltransferase [Glycomyces salinus]|uniref:glycosyltransferase n=1 Tax=Glycomyces salinus TaxID=980294 RepID=UPI0018EADFDD|nr:glycosyltransferase [Glycomyces salinus]
MFKRKPSVALPPEPIYGITWSIPENFGGMTNVLLHRSAAFARLGGRRIDILTLAGDLDLRSCTRELRSSGRLGKGVRLRNLWDELARMSDRALAKGFAADRPVPDESEHLLPYEGRRRTERLTSDGKKVLQVDTFRDDGTRLFSDRRDVRSEGTPGGRRLTLFTRKGTALRSWDGAAEFYFAWLDHVIGRKPSYLISDSKVVGRFLYKYRRPHITTVQVIHSAHLRREEAGPFGALTAGKLDLIKGMRWFDLVATLTGRQAEDLAEANLAGPNLVAIPNSRAVELEALPSRRDPRDGVMLARLTVDKRIDHAIDAMALARVGGTGVRLRIFGDGDHGEALRKQVDAVDAGSYVELMGYRHDAAAQFNTASFSLLTSKSEGMALVLVESMAAGCIPIAYDIRYGPRDIITDGVDGFLVPAGDVGALAATIARVAAMPETELDAMRAAARKRAADFSDAAITRRWATALAEAMDRKSAGRAPRFKARVENFSFTGDRLLVRGSVTGRRLDRPTASLSWSARKRPVYGVVPAELRSTGSEDFEFEAAWPLERADPAAGDTIDLYLEIETSGGRTRRRLAAPGAADLPESERLEPYVTVKGNLSFTVSSDLVEPSRSSIESD